MKIIRYITVVSLGVLINSQAFAEQSVGGFIATYIVPKATVEVKNTGSAKITGDARAYGIVAELNKDQWFGYIHYEGAFIDMNALPEPGVEVDEYRLGLGWRKKLAKGSVQTSVEYFGQREQFDFSMIPEWNDSGVGIHVNGEYLLGLIAGKTPIVGFIDVGYLDLNKSDAEEYRFGVKSMLSKNLGVMSAYRIFKQEVNKTEDKTTLKGLNLALSYLF